MLSVSSWKICTGPISDPVIFTSLTIKCIKHGQAVVAGRLDLPMHHIQPESPVEVFFFFPEKLKDMPLNTRMCS